jgi:hypothetical protein
MAVDGNFDQSQKKRLISDAEMLSKFNDMTNSF